MKNAKKKATKGTVGRILKYTAPYRSKLILAMIFACFYVTLNLTAPVVIGYAIDEAVEAGNVNFAAIANILLMVVVTVLCGAIFQWLMALCTNAVSYLTMRDMRRDVYAKFNSVPLKYIDGHPHGDLISRMINDIDAVGDGLLQGITQLFSGNFDTNS